MSLLGIHFSLQMGVTVPVPVEQSLIEVWESAEVKVTDAGRSGFQLVFKLGREPGDFHDYALLANPVVAIGSRVVLGVTVGGIPQVLFDGFITNQQFKPSMKPGESRLTVTGEDISHVMDQEERNEEYPGQSDGSIVQTILSRYSSYGVVPEVTTPEVSEQPTEDEGTVAQQETDYAYLIELAKRHGFTFYVEPGPRSGESKAVWGPPVRAGAPQPVLSVNLGAETNVTSLDFSLDGLAPEVYSGFIQDRADNSLVAVSSSSVSRQTLATADPLARARTLVFRQSAAASATAFAEAQALTDASVENAVTATGELDVTRYGSILAARALVAVRGAGFLFNGLWYVKEVTHKIQPGSYKQAFALAREATGAASSTVEV